MKQMPDLYELRAQIDRIDRQIQALFEQRMEAAAQVAAYKKEHSLPIFQTGREAEILQEIDRRSSPDCRDGARVLFTNLMDISKSLQQHKIHETTPSVARLEQALEHPKTPPERPVVACQGVAGAYSHLAARQMFPSEELHFFGTWEEVFQAVEEGRVDFGVVPIENSTAGSVREVYELMRRHDFAISRETKVRVEHCLAARPGVTLNQVERVYSHEQALAQCSEFLKAHPSVEPEHVLNTAMAAKQVAGSSEPAAAICSRLGAQEYGLEVLACGIQNSEENYTRFICISKELYPTKEADTISVALSLPNERGALYRMLTKFAVNNVNMTKIESRPVGNKNFDVIFYINFTGNLYDQKIRDLLGDLSRELCSFKFLGNYKEDVL